MPNQTFGYIRVSTIEQNVDRQRDALKPFDIPARNLYTDRQSGKDFERPAYRRLIRRLRRGDMLIVKSLDRLGRNYAEVQEQWRHITGVIGADIKVIDMPLLDTSNAKDLLGNFISDLVLQILSFAAQMERDAIRVRQAEGILAAKARGKKWGKPPIALPENFEDIFCRWQSGVLSVREAAALCGMSVRTLYEKTKERRDRMKGNELKLTYNK